MRLHATERMMEKLQFMRGQFDRHTSFELILVIYPLREGLVFKKNNLTIMPFLSHYLNYRKRKIDFPDNLY